MVPLDSTAVLSFVVSEYSTFIPSCRRPFLGVNWRYGRGKRGSELEPGRRGPVWESAPDDDCVYSQG